MTRLPRTCERCDRRYIPTGKTDNICEVCWMNSLRRRGNGSKNQSKKHVKKI